jgi:membrane associated rhomboid family serine protease
MFQVVNILIAGPDDTVAWGAHLGGMLVGALLVILLRRSGVPLFDRHTAEPS